MGLTPDWQHHWRETPSWISVSLSDERIAAKTPYTPEQAVEMVTAHMRRLFPGARVEVDSMRGRLPVGDPPHVTTCNCHEMRDYLVVREPDRALGTRHYSE